MFLRVPLVFQQYEILQNGVSIASEDGPPAIRKRRQVSEAAGSRPRRQLQDPFEVQIDPFGGINKGIND